MIVADHDLERLRSEVEAGAAWRDALGRWIKRTGPVSAPHPSGTNWIWLMELRAAGHAIDVGSAFGEIAADLSGEFESVEHLTRSSARAALVSARFRGSDAQVSVRESATADDQPEWGSADCVVFAAVEGWRSRAPAWIDSAAGIPARAARWLRPGGWLGCLLPDPLALDALRGGAGGARRLLANRATLRATLRELRDAGFADVRRYAANHRDVVPATSVARQGYLSIFPHDGRIMPRLPVAMQPLMFPWTLLLARR